MGRILKIIVIIVIVAVLGLFGYAATKPDNFSIERTAYFEVPAEKIFPHINSLKAWQAWSPFEKLDPAMKRTFSGPESGVDSVYEWEGNSEAGSGRAGIIESENPSKIVMKLDMFKPFEAHNRVEFTLEENEGSTNVTWQMTGTQNFPAKVMSVIFNCDKMVGSQFEEGFANLKAITESAKE